YVAYVKISPQKPVASILPSQTSACGTFTLSAKNLSPGNNTQYDFYLKDENGNIVQHLTYPDTRDAIFQPITPTVLTFYSIYVTVTDQCGNQATSAPVNVPVAPSSLVSQIQIKGNVNSVCLGSPVTFQNISTGGDRFTITVYDSNKKPILTLPAGTSDMNYTPTAAGIYYVSITAGNNGCGDAPVSALKQFTVYPIPAPNFTWTADQNFNVTFNNTTPGEDAVPASSLVYKWDFGDGSALDPSYIPATHHFDVSKQPFTVTLTATTPGSDCSAVIQQTINITFHGNLFLPNAFIPASSNKNLNTFIAKGFGLKTWRMQIFNNFGQLVWETTKLDNDGAPVEGWDGTYKGKIVEQGVYIWQITATLLNGEEWKGMSYHNSSPSKTGAIHLIR
ncbi:MAG TPA: gliding motility-associated C-terminal domain-containing protein, partial [Mucilaginibacter sp.]|nr:gliding motility-associated C-terminal domain-containing protein [Mucilaginibacter sp.]